jgi:hypothetical protein
VNDSHHVSLCRVVPLRGLLALALAVPVLGCPAGASVAPGGDATSGIFVTGTGTVTARPDVARFDAGVMVRATTAADALAAASATQKAVIDALRSGGVDEKDLQTSSLGMYEERTEMGPPMPMPAGKADRGERAPVALPQVHYVAQNVVTVRVRDLTKLGTLLGAAGAAGANQMGGVAFDLDDPAAVKAQAREKAMADARAQAEQAARLAGRRVGKVLVIRLGGGGMPGPVFMELGAAKSARDDEVPAQAGSLQVSETVEVRFELVGG